VEDPQWSLDVETGLIPGITCLCSPHSDDRPDGTEIDTVVIHSISLPPGEFETDAINDLFLGCLDVTSHPYFQTIPSLRVSSHFLIDRKGHLIQYVPVIRRAWHAGVSSFHGRERVNDFSVGIELIGSDEQPFSDQQYHALQYLLRALQEALPGLSPERVVGHCDIAPGRKTDPGPTFDWDRFRASLAKV
jgi:AmpD protein